MNPLRAALISGMVLLLLGAAVAGTNPPTSVQPILPADFAGWHQQGNSQTSRDPVVADPTNAAVLKEYGFTDLAISSFVREDGRTLKIRAARFADASGAFGAYTYYLQPDMTREQIGDQAASLGNRVLFYRGHILVDALFSEESPMSGAELRELAGILPRPPGNAEKLPAFLEYQPRRDYIANTQKYAMGPQALAALAPPVSADLVDFSASPEISLGHYRTPSGEATLMLIAYPTPQIAAEHLRRIDATRKDAAGGISTIENAGRFFDKRTGPIVAIASGPVSDSDAKALLGAVNYEAKVTWHERTSGELHDLYSLVLNVVILCLIIGGLAVVAGVAFGGIRILAKRLYPEKVFDRPEQMEFISLHLAESVTQGGAPAAGGSEGRQTPPS